MRKVACLDTPKEMRNSMDAYKCTQNSLSRDTRNKADSRTVAEGEESEG
jgi:hypothetical protein